MPAVSTMLPAGYGRKVRAEWYLVLQGSNENVFIEDTNYPSRSNEWADSLGAVDATMGNQSLLASDSIRLFVLPSKTGNQQLLSVLGTATPTQYIEFEIPNVATYHCAPIWTADNNGRIDWADAGDDLVRVSDGVDSSNAGVDFSTNVRNAANPDGVIVRVKELPA